MTDFTTRNRTVSASVSPACSVELCMVMKSKLLYDTCETKCVCWGGIRTVGKETLRVNFIRVYHAKLEIDSLMENLYVAVMKSTSKKC